MNLSLKNSLFGISFLLFLFSAFLRKEAINKPFDRLHEWLPAHVGHTVNIWLKEGITQSKGNLVFNYEENLKTDGDFDLKLKDKNGRSYYVSYPNLTFYAPFVVAKLLFLDEINEQFLVLMNLMVLLSITFLLLQIAIQLFPLEKWENVLAILISLVLFLYSPAVLWFYANVYFADMLVMLFFLFTIYYFIKLQHQEKLTFKIGFVFSLFLTCYTEWIGFLLALTLFLISVANKSKNKKFVLYACLLSPVIALCLFVIQGSIINGFLNFYDAVLNRYLARTGADKDLAEGGITIFNSDSWQEMLGNFNETAYHWLCILLILFIGLIILKKKPDYRANPASIILLLTFSAPVLHLLLLFNFSVIHEFAVVKFLPFFFFASCYLCYGILNVSGNNFKKVFAITSSIAMPVYMYFTFADYKKLQTIDTKFKTAEAGRDIERITKPDETIVVEGAKCAELIFYTKKVPFFFSKRDEAYNFIKWRNFTSVVYLQSDIYQPEKLMKLSVNNEGRIVTDSSTVILY